jgi:predicted nucleic acid-binding Zn ribbon protein
MAEKIPQHYHCQICGKAIPVSETLCSDECKEKYKAFLKKKKTTTLVMFALLAAFCAMILISSLSGI